MSMYSTDSLGRSSRIAGSRSHLAQSTANAPFLRLLNPMGRHYAAGYRNPNEDVMEEEDEDEEAEDGRIRDVLDGRLQESHHMASLTSPPRQDSDTELEQEDEVPQSFLIESRPRRSKSSASKAERRAAKRQVAGHSNGSVTAGKQLPPRPSELSPEVMTPEDPSTVFATTRPKVGLDAYERALWDWVNVYNLDAYLQEVYMYYVGKGIYCIALSRGLNLLTVGFVIAFSTFLLGCVDYSRVSQDGTGRLSDIVVDHCVSRFSGFTLFFFICFGIFYVFQVVEFIRGTLRLVDMYRFYTHLLGIPDADIQTISWPEVVRRISQIRDQNPRTAIASHANQLDASALHHSNSPPAATLDALDIANRIMRQENYLIALFNKDLLHLKVPLPPFIERFIGDRNGATLTQALEWNLRYCLLGHLFDAKGRVRKTLITNAKGANRAREIEMLKRRFVFMGFLNAIFAPFIVLYLLMYSFFRYFEEYHKNPSSIGGRTYTQYAQWKFREFNELPHLFKRRLDESYPVAGEYIDQFPKEKVALTMRFVAFVSGSFAAVLALATVLDPEIFVHFEITPHRTVIFYLGVFGSILAVARGMVPDAHRVFDPELLMREVISHTHYMPEEWKGKLHSQAVHQEFGHLFEMKVSIFVQELMSVVLTPFVLWYSLPACAPAIIDFFYEFTVHVDGLGYVCSFAHFDFKRHSNAHTGGTELNDERLTSKEGKMEMSLYGFKANNPGWNPTDPMASMHLSRMAEMNPNRAFGGRTYSQNAMISRLRSGGRIRSHRTPVGGYGYGPEPSFGFSPDRDRYVGYDRPTQRAAGVISTPSKRSNEPVKDSAFAGSSQMQQAGRSGPPGPSRASTSESVNPLGPSASIATTQPDDDEGHKSIQDEGLGPDGKEIPSELGDSYVHGVRTRGYIERDDEDEEEEEHDEGVMRLLTQIARNQRRAMG
ncbi:autophagy protein atg9 [Tulasnella sp. 418]|nr:autophagy protein atg9 [Tulasnella sp. 418]